MTQIEGGHIDDRVGAVPGPDSVNRRVSGPGTEPGSVPGLARLTWAICKRGYTLLATGLGSGHVPVPVVANPVLSTYLWHLTYCRVS